MCQVATRPTAHTWCGTRKLAFGRLSTQIHPRYGMGTQSQNRKSNTKTDHSRPPYQKASILAKKQGRAQQRTLFGGRAFLHTEHCVVCYARTRGLSEPHRAHHKLCPYTKTTRTREEAELEHNNRPINLAEDGHTNSGRRKADGEAFFYRRRNIKMPRVQGNYFFFIF